MKIYNELIVILSTFTFIIATLPTENIERHILTSFEEKEDTKGLFKIYHFLYKKSYELNSEEGVRRYRIFKNTLDYIKSENEKGHSYTLGYTPFMDFTFEEFEKIYLDRSPESSEENWRTLEKENLGYKKLFDSHDVDQDELRLVGQVVRNPIDWRAKTSPIRNQGKCGSCWAFAALGCVEANLLVKNKITTATYLSTQQLVDCDTASDGCNGGDQKIAILYYGKKVGYVTEDAYPYTATVGTCNQTIINDPKNKKIIIKGGNLCTDCKIEQWYSLLAQGPVLISSYATKPWMSYVKGILSVTSCDSGRPNHAVVAVGWGIENGVEYTIVRNSWGKGWGEGGHIRIKYQPELNYSCFINKHALIPLF